MTKSSFAKKISILISMLLLMAAAIFLYINLQKDSPLPGTDIYTFSHFVVPADENPGLAYNINSYQKDDQFVLFIPCRVNCSDLIFYSVDINGSYQERFEHDFTAGPAQVLGATIICMQSNLPSLEISINDRFGQFCDVNSDPAHETRAYGDMTLSTTDFDASLYDWNTVYKSREARSRTHCTMSIKGRGQSSWTDDKKPYLIELEENTSLLSMPSGSKWVLLANTVDHTLLRNEVLLNLADKLGIEYTPGIQNVDLFVDGDYLGCYSLCSKIEISKERVNIDDGRDYFFRWGIASGEYRTLTPRDNWSEDNFVELINPKDEAFNNKAFDIANQTMDAIYSNDFEQISKYIDVDSYIRYFWLSEISKNTDATIRSVYSYYDADTQKMYMIAPWDLDRTIGTVEPYGKETDYLFPSGWCCYYDKWLGALLHNEEFFTLSQKAYDDYVKNVMDVTLNELEGRISRIRLSADMNFTRWDYLERPLTTYSNQIAYYMGDSSYESEIGWLKEWLQQRQSWLSENTIHP